MSTFAKKFARTGCTSAIRASSIAFGLHRPCPLINKICDMDYLPKDPAILVSSVNMLLRDEEFDTLESLCYNFGTEPKDIKDYLYGHGFVYSEKQKQFRPIGYDSVKR